MEAAEGSLREKAALAHLGDIEVEAVVEVGKQTLKLGEAMALRPGAVLPLEKLAGEEFSVRVNGALLGGGEAAVVGERMTCRITRLVPVENQEGTR